MKTGNGPLFSIIMPSYNRAHLIPRAIQSILNQSFRDFELVIVDDGSSDNTRDVVRGFKDSRIRYVHQENRGVSAARNLGASQAQGCYVTFLDSDDEALTEWLAHFSKAFADDQTGVVCTGYFELVQQGDQETEKIVLPRRRPMFDNQKVLFLAGTFAVRRDLMEAVGGYADGLAFSENTELSLRLVPHCSQEGWKVISIDTPLVIYHKRSSDTTKSRDRFKILLESLTYVLTHHEDRLRKAPSTYGHYLGVAGVSAARLGRYSEAQHFFKSAIVAHPWNWRHYGRLFFALVPAFGRKYW